MSLNFLRLFFGSVFLLILCVHSQELSENNKTSDAPILRRRFFIPVTVSPKPALQNSAPVLKPAINFYSPHQYYKAAEPDFTWIIDDFKTQLNSTLLSPVFPLKGYSLGARARLILKSDNAVYISLSYKQLRKSGNTLDFPVIPSVYYTLKDENQNIVREECYRFGQLLAYDTPYYEQWIFPLNEIVNDNISIDIMVESQSVAQQGYSFDGTMACVIDDFRHKRAMVKRGLFLQYTSPYFYTSPEGYRVKALFRLNGRNENEGKGLAVEIHFLTGPNDANLTRSFPHTTTVTLLHPTDPTKRVVKSVVREMPQYLIDMGLHAEIDEVLDNDTLYCQIEIVPRSTPAQPASTEAP